MEVGILSESEEILQQKSFSGIILNEVLKMVSADAKTNVKQEMEELVAVSNKFL